VKAKIVISITMSIFLVLLLEGISAAETITFEPYTDEEKPYLIDGGTHNFDRMVADFGVGFTNNHFRFADMAAFWIYKFGNCLVPFQKSGKMLAVSSDGHSRYKETES